jgi:hypothetical protein
MNKKLLISLATAGLLLSGCSVMHFQNGAVEPAGRPMEKWHHNVAYSLLEVSPVINIGALCDDAPWSVVTTKETLVTGLAGAIDGILTGPLTAGVGVDIWDPQMVEYSCGE